MTIFINTIILLCIFLATIKFASSDNIYQKTIGFYFIFTKLIMLILFNSISKFEYIADIVLLLFLLELVAVLFFLLNKKPL